MHGFRRAAEDGLDEHEPRLAPVLGADEALGRLYVLEGATFGGTFIDRHLAWLPQLSAVRLRAFLPDGGETAAMWHAFRALARWCAPSAAAA